MFSVVGFVTGADLWISYLHLGAGLGLIVYAFLTSFSELRDLVGRDSSRRGMRLGGNALVQMLALVVILTGIAVLSVRYSVNWDWTEAKLHTLTDATVDMLAQIPEDQIVQVYGFFTAGSEDAAQQVLERYAHEIDRVEFEIFDPQQRPDLAERFEIRQNAVLLVCGGPCESATGTVRVLEANEQELTRAVRSVISEQRKVYFLTGHGEGAIDDEEASGYSGVKGALEAENLIVESLVLANLEAVPEDADAVVIAGPTHSVLDRELEALDVYLRGGGAVAVLSDPIFVTNLESQVREWGMELGDDVIVDQTIDLFSGPRIGVQPVVSQYGEHAITKDLANAATMFQLARSVRGANGDDVVELALTSEASWAETDVETFSNESRVGLDPEQDRKGPVAVAAARVFAVPGEGEQEGRLVVVGDADFARNRDVAKVYNADFFINIVNWLVGEEAFITIDRKVPRASMATMTRQQFSMFQYVSIFFLPEAILLAGILSWWRRRS
jgi:ABC-type uncharacterized transport system involved in gliding motility auxiliary subunit